MPVGDEPKIRIGGTPNPNAAKFEVPRAIFDEEGKSYFERPAPGENPLAEQIFDVQGVRAVFMADNFVTVTKEEDVGWPEIIDEIRDAILQELRRAG